ncbi:Membrane protein YdfJ [Corynebacterium occultum]|uniref:Membrane protein YdfJ n=1 Tax=Corynebacterium occultum TaxID=2675219 RepID=A0A6B8VWK0_9CORY|nr:MMPL family transporter [Corynebacterium occultum]QGU08513.1 Membrane protein YdfJ [Corynebacterium occultum]
MFEKWGELTYRYRKVVPWVIIATILVVHLAFGMRLGERMSQEGWEDPGADSTIASVIELDTFGRDDSGDVILQFEAPEGITLNDPTLFNILATHLRELKAEHPEQIAHVTSYFDTRNAQLITEDGTTAFAAIGLVGDGEQTLKDFRAIEDQLVGDPPEGVTVTVAGATAVADALDDGMSADILRAEVIALPVVAILLLFVFGSVVAATMPLIVGVLSILGSLGILSIIAGFAQINVFSQSVVTLLGLGLAIDYGLFMVSRFREELDKGRDVRSAVVVTTATAGSTVVFSAAMVAVALSSLLLFPQAFLKSVAYGAISAVGLAALLSITVLPAIFGMLGHNIDKWSVRRTSRQARRLEDTIWYRIPAWSMKHAKLVTAGIALALLALTFPIIGIKLGGINETYLPPDNETRVAQEQFNENFPQFRTEPIKLVVTNATNDQLVQVYQQANQVSGLTGRFSPSTATQEGTTVLSAGIEDREQNAQVIEQLRQIEAPEGVEIYIGGTPAMEVESIEALFEKLPWMALYMVVATFILMALVFGSVVLPAKAVIMSVLGLGATLGILTLMFVDGVGSSLFNFSPGPLMSPVLVLIIAIVYGLSTDYEVFLVSRMVEARDKGASTDEAIRTGTARTGSIITAAALIMIVVAAAFGFSEIVMMKYIAFGMIAALFLDATVIRMLLVPAVMHLLRDDNWWAPGFVKTAYAKLGHGAEPTALALDGAPKPPAPEPALVGAPTAAAATAAASPEPKPEPEPVAEKVAEDVDKNGEPIYEAEIVEENESAYQGRRRRNTEAVPFAELMKRLELERQKRGEIEK